MNSIINNKIINPIGVSSEIAVYISKGVIKGILKAFNLKKLSAFFYAPKSVNSIINNKIINPIGVSSEIAVYISKGVIKGILKAFNLKKLDAFFYAQ